MITVSEYPKPLLEHPDTPNATQRLFFLTKNINYQLSGEKKISFKGRWPRVAKRAHSVAVQRSASIAPLWRKRIYAGDLF